MTIDNIFTLLMLILLQAVLGIDNLLYISLESKNAPVEKQGYVRKVGIGLAIILRIGLLFLLTSVIKYFQVPFMHLHFDGVIEGEFNVHSIIVYIGGAFIIYTAIKEIWHMISLEEHAKMVKPKQTSIQKVIILIVIMNLVFSFDSILSAIALTDNLLIMSIAIVLGGLLMIWLSDKVSAFLKKNRMYEVLGLFILFLVGIMLMTEAGHLSHLTLFDTKIDAMSKTTFYFLIFVLVIIDIVQTQYQKKLSKIKEKEALDEQPKIVNLD
ncbi:MAG: tellurium resistance protein TerC [Chloroflexia bacterium]|nr:tellurium resistance protein TerC [Chloroflexia bacterium]